MRQARWKTREERESCRRLGWREGESASHLFREEESLTMEKESYEIRSLRQKYSPLKKIHEHERERKEGEKRVRE